MGAWQKKKTKNAVVLGHLDYKNAKNSLKDPTQKSQQNLTDRAVNSKSYIKVRPTTHKPLLNRFIRRTDLIEVLRKEKKWLKKVCRIFLADQKKVVKWRKVQKKQNNCTLLLLQLL